MMNSLRNLRARSGRASPTSALRVFAASLCVGVLLVGAVDADLAWAQTTNILQEDFTTSKALLDWTSLGGACLTAGSATNSGPSSTGIPACLGDSYYAKGVLSYGATPSTPAQTQTGLTNNQDQPGSGALRLTNGCATVSGKKVCYYQQYGAVILNSTYPSDEGIRVTFTTYTYGGDNSGGHGADGIGFYILDGSVSPNVGAWGGSLGYSCSNSNTPYNGMTGAYLGLGMDEYGNFLNQGDNTATGINGTLHPGEIGVRGWGNVNLAALRAINPSATVADVQNTCKNGGSYKGQKLPDYPMVPGSYVTGLTLANEAATTRGAATPITYTLNITPDGLLSLWYKSNATSTVGGYGTQVINKLSIADPAVYGPMPSNFRFGFGASTGGSNNVHEITCFQVVPSTQAALSPIAPTAVAGGTYVYVVSSDPDPVAGHVQAYRTVAAPSSSASAPVGTGTGSALWDAGDATHMSASARQGALYSTSSSGQPVLFNNLDAAAFQTWTASGCVPSGSSGVSVIENYTINPNYTSGSCSYLNGRLAGWMLGEIGANNDAHYLGGPANPNLLGLSGYTAFARANANRKKVLLYTSNDGFLYASDASTGNLVWGWMPRPFAGYLGNAPGLINATCGNPVTNGGCFDGHFAAADAVDASGNWATYVVGTAAGGALHYALGLATNSSNAPMPSTQPWSVNVSGGSSPQGQAPVIATINGQQYAVFVVNTTSKSKTTSTLYEVNIATGVGASTGSALSFAASSAMTYVPSTGTLWVGDAAGKVWSLNVSGSASSDAANATNVATMSPAAAVNYVGYTELGGLPYLWAASQNQIELFTLSGAAGQPVWASTGGSTPTGYVGNGAGGLTSSSTVMGLQSGGQVAAAPTMINGVLVVPVYVPPTGSCGEVGNAYYDMFDMGSGSLPKIPITYHGGAVVNGIVALGTGMPFSPSLGVTGSTTIAFPGTSTPPASGQSIAPILFGGTVMNKPVAWRQY